MKPIRSYTYSDAKYLYESNHYSEIFTDCINDIILNKEKFLNKICFSGWYYKNCNVNKHHGIKLNICIKDIKNNEGYIIREKNNIETTIYINDYFYDDNIKLKSIIQHELIHIVKLYSTDSNGLSFTKETVRDEIDDMTDNIKNLIPIDNQELYIDKLDTLLYILSPNEQLASINATSKYVFELSRKQIKDINNKLFKYSFNDFNINFKVGFKRFTTKEAQIYNILTYIDNTQTSTHFLTLYKDFLSIWEHVSNIFKLILCYYLDKHNHIKTPYIRAHILDDIDGKTLPINISNEFNICYNYITKVYEKYKKNLTDALYIIMNKQNLFLSEDELNDIKYKLIIQKRY